MSAAQSGFKREFQVLANKGMASQGEVRLFFSEKMFPCKDAIPPEVPLGFCANAGNMDKGVFEQMNRSFLLCNISQAINVVEGGAMAWIHLFYSEGRQFFKRFLDCISIAAEMIQLTASLDIKNGVP